MHNPSVHQSWPPERFLVDTGLNPAKFGRGSVAEMVRANFRGA